jgi:hypothetical protein
MASAESSPASMLPRSRLWLANTQLSARRERGIDARGGVQAAGRRSATADAIAQIGISTIGTKSGATSIATAAT